MNEKKKAVCFFKIPQKVFKKFYLNIRYLNCLWYPIESQKINSLGYNDLIVSFLMEDAWNKKPVYLNDGYHKIFLKIPSVSLILFFFYSDSTWHFEQTITT